MGDDDGPLFVITLTDAEFEKLSDPAEHLRETLMLHGGGLVRQVRLIIQREAPAEGE